MHNYLYQQSITKASLISKSNENKKDHANRGAKTKWHEQVGTIIACKNVYEIDLQYPCVGVTITLRHGNYACRISSSP